jgi:hypothetical protein
MASSFRVDLTEKESPADLRGGGWVVGAITPAPGLFYETLRRPDMYPGGRWPADEAPKKTLAVVTVLPLFKTEVTKN